MPFLARLGDKSDHGGTIITAAPDIIIDGVLVARQGDLHTCPIKGHGITPLSSGSHMIIDGRPVARIGDRAGCGATIITGSAYTTAN